jgi:transcriptional regulator with XRE-family HTH domain
VAFLLGRKNSAQLSRYEKRHTLPPLRTALAFEAIFQTPLAELFAGLRESVGQEISERIEKLDAEFQVPSDSKRQRRLNARKHCWIVEHRGADAPSNA